MALQIKNLKTETLEQDIATYTRLAADYGFQSPSLRQHLQEMKTELARRTEQPEDRA
ncbi:hypothetical protein GCM10027258_62580 [Amycolatopsis stemonae]